jgi:hypothetical protein
MPQRKNTSSLPRAHGNVLQARNRPHVRNTTTRTHHTPTQTQLTHTAYTNRAHSARKARHGVHTAQRGERTHTHTDLARDTSAASPDMLLLGRRAVTTSRSGGDVGPPAPAGPPAPPSFPSASPSPSPSPPPPSLSPPPPVSPCSSGRRASPSSSSLTLPARGVGLASRVAAGRAARRRAGGGGSEMCTPTTSFTLSTCSRTSRPPAAEGPTPAPGARPESLPSPADGGASPTRTTTDTCTPEQRHTVQQ